MGFDKRWNKKFMKLFTRWTIIMATTSVGCYFVGKAGGFSGLLKYDSSYLGFIIIAVATAAACYMGKISKAIDEANDKHYYRFGNNDRYRQETEKILKSIGVVKFASEKCFDLGLLSTVIGLVLMFLGMGSNTEALIGAIKNGLSTAFIPTLVGMVANLILSLQLFIAEHELKD
jgi:flagellar motor component MotA